MLNLVKLLLLEFLQFHDANCKGSLSYLNLAKELVDNNENVKVSW